MDFTGKKIGIWGFGVVGKSVFSFLKQFDCKIEVFDKTDISDSSIIQNKDLENFLNKNDLIIPSPGIDLRNYKNFENKFISETDIFFNYFKKPIIALTGTVGKTSIVNLLYQILKNKIKVGLGGNVGFAMLDLLKEDIDYALLELSSFQLELNKKFSADLAIWTNFFTNHLDRHSNLEDYFLAKYKIIELQNKNDKSLINLNLIEKIKQLKPKSQLNFFAYEVDQSKLKFLEKEDNLFFVKDGVLKLMSHNSIKDIALCEWFPEISYKENWLIITAACYLQNIKLEKKDFEIDFKLPEHRLEKFAQFNGATFYNDSKSTVSESTINAIKNLSLKTTRIPLQARDERSEERAQPLVLNKLKGRDERSEERAQPLVLNKLKGRDERSEERAQNLNIEDIHSSNLILILGGLSKGADRSELIKFASKNTKKVYVFGKESDTLKNLCDFYGINSLKFDNLDSVINDLFLNLQEGDNILFSPAGSSYDLFKNYEDRGNKFKELVRSKIDEQLFRSRKTEI